jgi:hypothetical protein
LEDLDNLFAEKLSALIVKQEVDNDIQKSLVTENSAAGENNGMKCSKEWDKEEGSTTAIQNYLADIEKLVSANTELEVKLWELYQVTLSGDKKCVEMAKDVKQHRRRAERRGERAAKSREALKEAIFDKKQLVAINKKQDKLLAAENKRAEEM